MKKSTNADGVFFMSKNLRSLKDLFNKFYFFDAVKETLFIHPSSKYFTHVTRTWKNSDYYSHQILLLQHIVEWLALLHLSV
jgi:hypothetical protein